MGRAAGGAVIIPSDYTTIEQRARVKRGTADRESIETRTSALEEQMTSVLARVAQLEMDVVSLMLGSGAITEQREVRPIVVAPAAAAPGRAVRRYGNVLRVA